MLVLTRRAAAGDHSVIHIGPDITVTVVSVEGGSVRLGVSAPPAVGVHRREVYDAKKAEDGERP